MNVVSTAIVSAFLVTCLLRQASNLLETMFVEGAIGLTLLCHFVQGLYPACGLSYSIEYRRILRNALLVLSALAFALAFHHPTLAPFPWLEVSIFAMVYILPLTSLRSLARRSRALGTAPRRSKMRFRNPFPMASYFTFRRLLGVSVAATTCARLFGKIYCQWRCDGAIQVYNGAKLAVRHSFMNSPGLLPGSALC